MNFDCSSISKETFANSWGIGKFGSGKETFSGGGFGKSIHIYVIVSLRGIEGMTLFIGKQSSILLIQWLSQWLAKLQSKKPIFLFLDNAG
jgi:hypothetical protein